LDEEPALGVPVGVLELFEKPPAFVLPRLAGAPGGGVWGDLRPHLVAITLAQQQAAIVCVNPEAYGRAAALRDENPLAGQLIAEDLGRHVGPVEDAAGAAACNLPVGVLDLDDALST